MHLEIGQMPKWIGDLTTNRDADYVFKVYKYRYFVCLILKYKEIPILIQVQILYQHYITHNNQLLPFRFLDIIDILKSPDSAYISLHQKLSWQSHLHFTNSNLSCTISSYFKLDVSLSSHFFY